MRANTEILELTKGLKIRVSDGWQEKGFPEIASSEKFRFARTGDKLVLNDKNYKFNVATYASTAEEKWLYTYSYSPNEAWLTYNNDLTADSYRQNEYVFETDTYFRICLRRTDGAAFSEAESINNVVGFIKPETLTFALLTDTHYVVNGNWDSVAGEIWAANRRQKFSGIIHLGDITDGMLSANLCEYYSNIVLDDLRETGAPVWVTLGNHDSNYFKQNTDRLSPSRQSEMYLGGGEPRYYTDFSEHNLRLIFIDSYDAERELRYGYSKECVSWLDKTLQETPEKWNVIIFSHLTPLASLQVWAKQINGEGEIMTVLNNNAEKILAFINGHMHTDHLCNEEAFPIVSIGCAKCEYFLEYKMENSVTFPRKMGDKTQNLWDIMIVDSKNKIIKFERQGAGKNRIIKDGKARWL